jgi:hypothetical protein
VIDHGGRRVSGERDIDAARSAIGRIEGAVRQQALHVETRSRCDVRATITGDRKGDGGRVAERRVKPAAFTERRIGNSVAKGDVLAAGRTRKPA